MSSTTVTDRPETANRGLFDPTFTIRVGAYSSAIVEPDTKEGLVAVTLGNDDKRYLAPAEALSLAAALQAVSTFLLEEPREIRRSTAPGQPQAEELQGVGL